MSGYESYQLLDIVEAIVRNLIWLTKVTRKKLLKLLKVKQTIYT